MERTTVNPWTWQQAFGYVQATEVSAGHRTLYCSGQGSVDAAGAPLHPADLRGQINQAMDNLATVLAAADYALADVVRLQVYTTDVDQFLAAYDTFAARLAAADCRTTCTLVGVTRLALPTMLVEIEAIAVK